MKGTLTFWEVFTETGLMLKDWEVLFSVLLLVLKVCFWFVALSYTIWKVKENGIWLNRTALVSPRVQHMFVLFSKLFQYNAPLFLHWFIFKTSSCAVKLQPVGRNPTWLQSVWRGGAPTALKDQLIFLNVRNLALHQESLML